MDDLGDDEDGVPLLDPEVRVFFQQFGNNYPDPQFRDRFRLMLVGLTHNREATRWDRRCFLDDTVAVADVTETHVADAVREGAELRGKGLHPDRLKVVTAGVFAAAKEEAARDPDKPWLECLHDATVAAVNNL
jgi:hypothetical protein